MVLWCLENQFGRLKIKVDKISRSFLKIRTPRENLRSAPAYGVDFIQVSVRMNRGGSRIFSRGVGFSKILENFVDFFLGRPN